MVDLSILEQYGRAAVRCDSREEAEEFMEAMWQQHPEKVNQWWSRGNTNWGTVHGGRCIYYVPRIFHSVTGSESSYCQSSSLSWIENHDYKVVPFDVLTYKPDFGEINTANLDIKSLFGME